MYYTYVLISIKTKRLYIGSTSDLRQRLREHNHGEGGSFTKKNKPFKLIFYEAFLSKIDALEQERFYKTGYGREVLKQKIKNSLREIDLNCGVV